MQDLYSTQCLDSLPFNWGDKNRSERTSCLICMHPADRLGEVIPLGNTEVLIGRDADCDVEIPDDSVSRRHALLRPSAGSYVAIDLGSTNGTYVNDARIEIHTLEPGDRLRLGNQIFKYFSADRSEAEYFENAYRMMTTDGLTQVHNKRYLLDVAERELRRAARTGKPMSLLMFDIDRFKLINDTYGHLTGDEVLIEFTRRLMAALRGDEVLARYGGEEFCLMLPDTALADALKAGERVRAVVAENDFVTQHAQVSVTVSVGVTCMQPPLEISAIELIEQADKQLYLAKNGGRNRVVG
jgi:diguanylate cyclase (GGDEF)-like protein